MKNYILSLVSIFFCLNLHSQNEMLITTDDGSYNHSILAIIQNMEKEDTRIKGTAFITEFKPGKISGLDKTYLIRYDAYKDEMQAKISEKKIILIKKEKSNGVVFSDGTRYRVFEYLEDDQSILGFLKIVKDGSTVSLLKKERIILSEAKKEQSGYHKGRKAAFKRLKDLYFIVLGNKMSIKSLKTKKNITALFPQKKKEIEKYMKVNKFKISKEKDLVQLVSHIDSLIKN